MKTNTKTLGFTSLFAVALIGSSFASQPAQASLTSCVAGVFGGTPNSQTSGAGLITNPHTQWRAADSVHMQDSQGQVIPVDIATSSSRESQIRSSKSGLESFIKSGDVPFMIMVPELGVRTVQTRSAEYGDKNGRHIDIYPTMDVSNLSQDASGNTVFRATLLLPVSGHNGLQNAELWAKTDSVTVTVTDLATGKKTVLVNDVLSRGFVSIADIEFPAAPGQKLHIEYSRRGQGQYSGTTSRGFMSGRNIELTIK